MPCKLLFFLLVLFFFYSIPVHVLLYGFVSLVTILLAAKYVRLIIIRNLVFKGTNIASKLVQNIVTYEFVESFAQFSCFYRLACFAPKGTAAPFQGVLRTCVILSLSVVHGNFKPFAEPAPVVRGKRTDDLKQPSRTSKETFNGLMQNSSESRK